MYFEMTTGCCNVVPLLFFFTHYTSGADFVHRPMDANGSVNYCLYHKACPPSILCCLWARGFELWRINSRAKADLLAFTPTAQISWTGVQLPRRGSRGIVLMRVSGAERGTGGRAGETSVLGVVAKLERNISAAKGGNDERRCGKSS